jgi:transposase InsO family protein
LGAKYFLTFIDDFSRFLWIYTIQSKDEVCGKLKEFKSLVENQSKKGIKCTRTDHRGEYIANDFKEFLISHDISWQRIVPYTPHENGVVEQKNGSTIVEMAR